MICNYIIDVSNGRVGLKFEILKWIKYKLDWVLIHFSLLWVQMILKASPVLTRAI